MATFHDSALASNDAGGTTLSTADALTVTAGDLVWVHAKWEDDDTATVTADTGAATPAFSVANAKSSPATGPSSATFYWIATSTGTVNPRMVTSASVSFRQIRAISITPAGGTTLELGNVAVANATSNTPSSGAANATAAGVAFGAYALYGSRTITPNGSFIEPAEFNSSITAHGTYFLQSGSGSLTASGTLSSSVEWIAQLAIFNEVGGSGGTSRGTPFGHRGTAFNGGRTFNGILQREIAWQARLNSSRSGKTRISDLEFARSFCLRRGLYTPRVGRRPITLPERSLPASSPRLLA